MIKPFLSALPNLTVQSKLPVFIAVANRCLIVGLLMAGFATADRAQAQDNEFKIEGTYQIEKGQRHGWLILNINIPEGFHIYALTQEGTPPPTKIKLAESDDFKLMKAFKANKKPKVIEHDPVFEQRMEEYEGKVALLAPLKISDGVDLEDVSFDLKISGQLCNDSGCQLFKNKKVEIEFAGYYEKEEKQKNNKKGK